MARGRSKSVSQSEKLLQVLLTGKVVTLEEINATLGGHIVNNRIPTYLWELKELGAEINRVRSGRKITALQLMNVEKMLEYHAKRFSGAITESAPAV